MAEEANTPPEGGDDLVPKDRVEEIVKDRLARQKSQLLSGLPSKDDIDAWKEKAEQFDAMEEASKDDAQKLADQVASLEQQLAQKDTEIDGLKTANRNVLVQQAITAAASRAQYGEDKDKTFADPEDAVAFIDAASVEFDDDGKPSNVETLVSKLAETKPHFLGEQRAPAPSFDGGARETTTDDPTLSGEQEHARWLAERI